MIVSIHQPDFLPWLGFFDRWEKSDVYIVLDDVQFLRRGWHHRDKLKTHNGVIWLTIPVKKKGLYHQTIKEVKIDNQSDWVRKHLNTIKIAYEGASSFDKIYSKIKEIYKKNHSFLIDLNMDLLRFVASELRINTPIALASDFSIQSSSTQRLVDLVKSVHGSIYITGLGSKNYLDESLFKKESVKVLWHEFEHPVYHQFHGEFIPMLSSLDYLMMRNKT